MKKVYIITRHNIVNYGSFFQTYATVAFFESIGYECKIINYVSRNETILGNLVTNARRRNGVHKFFYFIFKFPDEFIKTVIFRNKIYKYLPLTKRYSSIDELKKSKLSGILCSGSDQLWGYMPNKQIDQVYFLEFGKKDNEYISFSSSFGRLDFGENWNIIKKYLKKYSILSLREISSVDYINKEFNYDAFQLIDPTLCIDKKIWWEMCYKKLRKSGKYILVYQLRKNSNIDNYVNHLAKINNLKIIRVTTQIYDFFRFNNSKVLRSPKYVLTLFKNASLIVTDSFHATVMSIVFEKNFIDILPPITSLRIRDLLNQLNLSSRILSDFDDFNIIKSNIDYSVVDNLLEQIKTNGIRKFKDKLKKL